MPPSRVPARTPPDPHGPSSVRRRPARWRKALWQLLGALAVLAALEVVLALAGVRPLSDESDPYVGFSGQSPLFVEAAGSEGRDLLRTAPGKLKWFNAQEFPREKAPGTFRIVTLGGSTVYGHPFDDAVSFSAWLRELLAEAQPDRTWEVINCGGISYASYREVVVLRELLQYRPDLVIVYSGPNEFLEQRTYADLGRTSPWLLALGSLASRTRSYSLAHALTRRLAGESGGSGTSAGAGGVQLAAEVDTLLERPAGLELYRRDDALRAQVLEHFRFNLERMAELCRQAGTRVLFVTPASQLRDCAPFKSEPGPGLDPDGIAAVEALREQARQAESAGDGRAARTALQAAVALDPRDADLLYRLGEALFAAGEHAEARVLLEQARDEDVCPLRPLSEMHDILVEVAAAAGAPALDFVRLVDDECERRHGHRVPGREQFLDHVHLDVDGYELLGRALFDRMAAEGLVAPGPDWGPAAVERVRARVMARLDDQARGFALRNLAKTLGWAGKRAEAERLALQTLDVLGGGDAESHFLLGTFALEEGRLERAIAEFGRATEIDPDYSEAWLNLADALIKAGRAPEALPMLQRSLALDPDQASAWNVAGLLLDAAGRSAEALVHFERALQLAPDDPQTHNNRALTLARAHRPDEAEAALRRALVLDPGHAQAHFNLGLLLRRQGRDAEAAAAFRRALASDPDYAKAAEQLRALEAAGGTR